MFDRIRISSWRQFGRVDILFHPRLTVITGANGSGKTTILNILGSHFGWDVPLVRSPYVSKRRVVEQFLSDHWSAPEHGLSDDPPPTDSVGWVRYADGRRAYLRDPQTDQSKFKLKIENSIPVAGIHIPSHRPVPGHAPVASLSTAPPTKAQAAENYRREVLSRYLGSASKKSPGWVLKETLMTLCLVAEGGRRVAGWEEAATTVDQFEAILRIMLPESIGFSHFRVDLPELYMVTSRDIIPFDAISGGTASIVDIAYQIFMYSPPGARYVAIVDEPENHLHPAMQRRILPDLLTAFPDVQFVVATHNPFIISSTRETRVYALVHDDDGVVSRNLDTETKSGTSSEVLRDVLGMHTTLPIWVERAVDEIVTRNTRGGITPEAVAKIRQEMTERGLENLVLDVLAEFAAPRHA